MANTNLTNQRQVFVEEYVRTLWRSSGSNIEGLTQRHTHTFVQPGLLNFADSILMK